MPVSAESGTADQRLRRAGEHVQTMTDSFAIEQQRWSRVRPDGDIFRAAHSLKGRRADRVRSSSWRIVGRRTGRDAARRDRP
jgi:hypothetical protein